MEKRMLVIEEDTQLREQLQQNSKAYFLVEYAEDGISGLLKAMEFKPDIIIVNYRLPKLSGLEVCQIVRNRMEALIFIMANSLSEDERVACFEAGAEDVVQTTLSFRELFHRINVHLRKTLLTDRNPSLENQSIHFGPLIMDRSTHQIYLDQDKVALTRKEFAILWTLVKKQNAVVSRNELLRVVWSYDHSGDDRMIDTHINRIRKKLHRNNQSVIIKTIWGIGYKIEQNHILSSFPMLT